MTAALAPICKVIGWILLASPFVAITVVMISTIGWLPALLVWAAVVVIVILIAVGVELTND